MDYIDRSALLDALREVEENLHKVYDNAGTQDARNSAYGKWIMLADCIMKIKKQPRMYPMERRKNRRKRMEKLRECPRCCGRNDIMPSETGTIPSYSAACTRCGFEYRVSADAAK